jgi:SAM-dependent methyltransferase
MNYSSAFFEEITPVSLSSAKVMVPIVMELVRPSSVVDVGCGIGAWLSRFREYGVRKILGLDGAYVDRTKLLIPCESYIAVDLARPFTLPETFDLAVSLEVAEHLPAPSAKGFVQCLCQLAPVVMFSAAVPGQMGTGHLNEQWASYWHALFSSFRYRMFDPFRPVIWHDQQVALWYRQNTFLYVQEDFLTSHSNLSKLPDAVGEGELMLIDANIFFGLRATIKRLPSLIQRAVRQRALR